jgi:hypothetical protein
LSNLHADQWESTISVADLFSGSSWGRQNPPRKTKKNVHKKIKLQKNSENFIEKPVYQSKESRGSL